MQLLLQVRVPPLGKPSSWQVSWAGGNLSPSHCYPASRMLLLQMDALSGSELYTYTSCQSLTPSPSVSLLLGLVPKMVSQYRKDHLIAIDSKSLCFKQIDSPWQSCHSRIHQGLKSNRKNPIINSRQEMSLQIKCALPAGLDYPLSQNITINVVEINKPLICQTNV